MVVVALGEPGVPLICCAWVVDTANTSNAQLASSLHPTVPMKIRRLDFMAFSPYSNEWKFGLWSGEFAVGIAL
jgi:hypothetical protein